MPNFQKKIEELEERVRQIERFYMPNYCFYCEKCGENINKARSKKCPQHPIKK